MGAACNTRQYANAIANSIINASNIIAKFSKFHIPLIKRTYPQLLANQLVGVQPLPSCSSVFMPVPGPPEFTEAIALWITENYEFEVETHSDLGEITLSQEADALAKVVVHIYTDRCQIHMMRFAYEHPDFFDHLAKVLDHIASGAPVHELDPDWDLLCMEDTEDEEYRIKISPATSPAALIHLRFKYANPKRVRNRGPPVLLVGSLITFSTHEKVEVCVV